jgi:hypothetical protein
MIELPPSTGIAAPVTKPEADEARNNAREVVDCAPAGSRRARQHPLVQARDLHTRAFGEIGVDPARQDGIGLDVVGRSRAGTRAGELHDAAIARGIGRREARAEQRHH